MAGGDKKKKKSASEAEVVTWQQKKATADAEEPNVIRELEEIIAWTSMIESMNDAQLKEYMKSRPENQQTNHTGRAGKGAATSRKKSGKPKSPPPPSSSCASQGLMASIWKFHKDDEGDGSMGFGV